jgi:hypothetical protein
MKKLIVLAIVMLLVALGAYAQVTITGEVEHGTWTTFQGDEGGETDIDTKLNITVDDNNSAFVKWEANSGWEPGDLVLQEAWVMTALGDALMLPVSLDLYAGRDEWTDSGWGKVTMYELEDVADLTFRSWGYGGFLGYQDMITVGVFGAPSTSELLVFVEVTYDLVVVVVGFSTEKAKLFPETEIGIDLDGDTVLESDVYALEESSGKFENGQLALAAEASIDVMPDLNVAASVSFRYELASATDEVNVLGVPVVLPFEIFDADNEIYGDKYQYGVGVAASYMDGFVKGGIGFRGVDEAPAADMTVELEVSPIDLVSIDVGAVFGLSGDMYEDEQKFNELDFSIAVKPGASEWRVGYWYADFENGGGGIKKGLKAPDETAPIGLDTKGVFYFQGKVAY